MPQQAEASLPEPRQEVASAATSAALYVIGGFDAARRDTSSVFAYNGAWTRGPDLPIPVDHASAAVLNDSVFVAGGNSFGVAQAALFHLAGGAWTRLAPMHHARGALGLVPVGRLLYALGGLGPAGEVAAVEAYDPSANAWTDVTQLPQPRDHGAGFSSAGMACMAGGRTPVTARVDCYDPAAGSWTRELDLPAPTSGAGAAFVGAHIAVAGGEDAAESRLVDQVFWFQAATWTAMPMLTPRHGIQLAVYGGRAWACGGATAPGYAASPVCTSIA